MGRVAIGAGPTLAKTTLGLGAVKIDPQRQQNRVKQNKSLVADLAILKTKILCLKRPKF